MESNASHEYDLPLSANYNEVCVEHFVLDLSCKMSAKIFQGSITYFIRVLPPKINDHAIDVNAQNIQTNATGQIKLDCYDISVTECLGWRVSRDKLGQSFTTSDNICTNALQVPQLQLDRYWQSFITLRDGKEKEKLQFVLEKHCLKINVPYFSGLESIVVIVYFRTHPGGPSLMWTNDQDGRPCVFTIGDSFNNRSLFPAQDMPQAMPTWHCNVKLADPGQMVLMTGEAEPVVHLNDRQEVVFHFFNSYRMPASTFALAVGSWSCHVLDQALVACDNLGMLNQANVFPPRCRIHCPSSMKSDTVNLLTKYLPACFASIAFILEPYPFQHLDILVTADCFDSLGLACPNLLILSQSLLSSDLSLFHRIAHELCHTWFGILLGPRNWTEEWLTEGLCCYLEDIVHARAMKWTEFEIQERNELKSYLKYKVLKTEIDYTPSSLQMLRPDGDTEADTSGQNYVTNGISSERSHIHYMKGFFLLKLLETTAGQDSFLSAVKQFVMEYKGKLFSSQEILDYFFDHCPSLKASILTVPSLCLEWLDSPGLPMVLESFPYPIHSNRLYQQVIHEFDVFKNQVPSGKRKRKGGKEHYDTHHIDQLDAQEKFSPDQIVLLLGLIAENPEVRISQSVMDSMRHRYSINEANAEVQHAWCEVVIQRCCQRWYGDVQRFLHQHRAMGLYLYGELMISERWELQAIAHRCYQHHRRSMPRATLKELREILAIDDDDENETEEEQSGNDAICDSVEDVK